MNTRQTWVPPPDLRREAAYSAANPYEEAVLCASSYGYCIYRSMAENNGIIIVSIKIPAITAAIIFFVFLLYMNTPLFLKGCDTMLVLFGLTLIILVFMHFGKSRQKNTKRASEEFWRRERESRFVPRKDISSLDYLVIPYDSLPFRFFTPGPGEPVRLSPETQDLPAAPDTGDSAPALPEAVQKSVYSLSPEYSAPLSEELADTEHAICALSKNRILNLSGISNTDLRLTYGTANLEPLTACDQNFTALICALQKWGTLLVSAGEPEDAVTVLSYAVSIGSDIAGTYALLASLYEKNGEFQKISALRESAEQLSTLMKPSILRDLDRILERADSR